MKAFTALGDGIAALKWASIRRRCRGAMVRFVGDRTDVTGRCSVVGEGTLTI
jgi:hypothetical protein